MSEPHVENMHDSLTSFQEEFFGRLPFRRVRGIMIGEGGKALEKEM